MIPLDDALIRLAENEARISFEPVAHTYQIDGTPAVSVTTALGVLEKAGLLPWAVRTQRSADLKALEEMPPLPGETHRDWIWRVSDALAYPAAHKQVALSAANRGTRLHKVLETWADNAMGLPTEKFVPQNPLETRAVHEVHGMMAALGVVPVASERKVIPLPGVCGTFDLLAWVGGRLLLCDLKTGKRLKSVYDSHALQTAAYAHALTALGFPIEGRMIFSLDRDSGDMLTKEIRTPLDEDFAAFTACVALWQWRNRYFAFPAA